MQYYGRVCFLIFFSIQSFFLCVHSMVRKERGIEEFGAFILPAKQNRRKKSLPQLNFKKKRPYFFTKISVEGTNVYIFGLFESIRGGQLSRTLAQDCKKNLIAELKKSGLAGLKKGFKRTILTLQKNRYEGIALGTLCVMVNDTCYTAYIGKCMAVCGNFEDGEQLGDDHLPVFSEKNRILEHGGKIVYRVVRDDFINARGGIETGYFIRSIDPCDTRLLESYPGIEDWHLHNIKKSGLLSAGRGDYLILNPKISEHWERELLFDKLLTDNTEYWLRFSRVIGQSEYSQVGVIKNWVVAERRFDNQEDEIQCAYVLLATSNFWRSFNEFDIGKTISLLISENEKARLTTICELLCKEARGKQIDGEMIVLLVPLKNFRARVRSLFGDD